MKKYLALFLSLCPLMSFAQPGYITTIAGNGTTGFSGDGGAATSAQLGQVFGVAVDNIGNKYLVDVDNSRIRKVSVSGTITTVAGGGTSMGDGVPATAANLNLGAGAVATDAYGNIYFTDGSRVRKMDLAGTITTVAGTLTPGFSGDGGPGSAAQLNLPHGICVDHDGNVYISDEGNIRVRKVSSAGIITTVAGTGIAGFSGDGGPASAAQLGSPGDLCMDPAGNLCIADRGNGRIRKIDASGIISTYAGNGSGTSSGDGGPALAAGLIGPMNMTCDNYGNFYLAEYSGYPRVRKINSSGTINTFAGGVPSGGDNIPATSSALVDIVGVAADNFKNIYISDKGHFSIRKVSDGPGIPAYSADSFLVFHSASCTDLSISILPAHYYATLQVKTWFGDGAVQMNSFSAASGYSCFDHAYNSPGRYTVKHVVYKGSLAIDSLQYAYDYKMCNVFQVGYYYDANGNCLFDAGDHLLSHSVTVEVDSNGVAIDTLSTTSGFYYSAYGASSDVYSFKIISLPAGFHASCPGSGIAYDTIGAGSSAKFVGVECGTSSSFDLGVHAITPVTGVHDQWGKIYVQNAYCVPTNATVTVHYSSKYAGMPMEISPAPTSVSGSAITWNISSLSATQSTPLKLTYAPMKGATALTVGDTVHSYYTIDPVAGDTDPTTNELIIVDTVRAGYDPNHIWVSPEGCMPLSLSATTFKYTVNFENTGNDTAHNIYVLDTLSEYLDESSLRTVMSSHEMYVTKWKAAGRTIVKFNFPNIKLLDSSHHGLCDGAFIYSIGTKPGIPAGASVHGRVGIYFDANDVVMTNTVENRKGCPIELAVSEQLHENPALYPNPVNDELVVRADQNAFSSFTITNSVGQEIIRKQITNTQTRVNVKALASGIYYVVFSGTQGREVVKFVKE